MLQATVQMELSRFFRQTIMKTSLKIAETIVYLLFLYAWIQRIDLIQQGVFILIFCGLHKVRF